MDPITITLYFSYKNSDGWHPFVTADADRDDVDEFESTNQWIGSVARAKIGCDPEVSAIYIHEEPVTITDQAENVVPFKFTGKPPKKK